MLFFSFFVLLFLRFLPFLLLFGAFLCLFLKSAKICQKFGGILGEFSDTFAPVIEYGFRIYAKFCAFFDKDFRYNWLGIFPA